MLSTSAASGELAVWAQGMAVAVLLLQPGVVYLSLD